MLDNLDGRYSLYLMPGNILQNYYIRENDKNLYSLSDGLFEYLIQGTVSGNASLNDINKRINTELAKYEKKGYELRNKIKRLTDRDIEKLFQIKFGYKSIKEKIYRLETDLFLYYVLDISEIKNGKVHTERNILFFTKSLNEYIGRFTLTIINSDVSIGSIFITTSKQRMGFFTQVLKNDLIKMLPKNIQKINVFSILKKGIGFYKKMEKEGRFKFTKGESDGVFYIK